MLGVCPKFLFRFMEVILFLYFWVEELFPFWKDGEWCSGHMFAAKVTLWYLRGIITNLVQVF